MFDTSKDAYQKLGHTVILLNETPIWITGTGDGEGGGKTWVTLKYYSLPVAEGDKPEAMECKLDEKEVDFRSISSRLGYMNTPSPEGDIQAIFLSRMAKRQSVQGINQSNVTWTPFITKLGKVEPEWNKFYKTEGFSNLLKGKYPSRTKAAKAVLDDGGVTSLAFNRWFAYKKTKVGPYYLEYKGKDIGWSPDLKKINLSKSYTHLQETLEYYDIPFEL